jgi:hypothetical protein
MAFLRFEDLRVFKAAEVFADEIWEAVNTWETFAKLTVGKQLVRAIVRNMFRLRRPITF